MQPSDLLLRESTYGSILMRDGSGSLRLVESNGEGGDAVFNDDGTFNAVLLRPCVGRGPAGVGGGPGRRIYTNDLLEALARDDTVEGWPSYMNHESPIARRARMGLPRPPSDLACEIVETSHVPDLTGPDDAKYDYQPGALVARLKPATAMVEDLVRRVPRLIRFSLNGQATNMRRAKPPWNSTGEEGWLVEGVEDDPENSSWDMVTTAGAGGVVRSLLETHYADGHDGDDELLAQLGDVDDERLAAYLREHRPDLDLTESAGGDSDMGEKSLVEVLTGPEVTTHFTSVVESVLEAKGITSEESGNGDDARKRENAQRALGRKAKSLIETAKLPGPSAEDLLDRYKVEEQDDGSLVVGESLRLVEAVTDGEGNVTKTAGQVLEDRLKGEIDRERKKLAEAAPTIPWAPGGPSGDGEGGGTALQFGAEGSAWGAYAREHGLDPTKFGAKKPAETTA